MGKFVRFETVEESENETVLDVINHRGQHLGQIYKPMVYRGKRYAFFPEDGVETHFTSECLWIISEKLKELEGVD